MLKLSRFALVAVAAVVLAGALTSESQAQVIYGPYGYGYRNAGVYASSVVVPSYWGPVRLATNRQFIYNTGIVANPLVVAPVGYTRYLNTYSVTPAYFPTPNYAIGLGNVGVNYYPYNPYSFYSPGYLYYR
jgi:hypothetical protein